MVKTKTTLRPIDFVYWTHQIGGMATFPTQCGSLSNNTYDHSPKGAVSGVFGVISKITNVFVLTETIT